MNEIITRGLAAIFDFFKARNPKIAGIILLAIGTAYYFVSEGGAEYLGENGAKVTEYILLVWTALQGSRTTSILNEGKK